MFQARRARRASPAGEACARARSSCRPCAQRGATARAAHPLPRTKMRSNACMADAGRAWAPQTYSNDDTILSWDLINEPRCERIGCDTEMLAWIEEMAPYVKALDGNHLLTVGAPAAVFLFFFFFFFFFVFFFFFFFFFFAAAVPWAAAKCMRARAMCRRAGACGAARRRCLLHSQRLDARRACRDAVGRGCRHAWQTAGGQDTSLPRLTRRAPQAWTAFTTGATASRPTATRAAGRATPGRTSCRSTPCARLTTRACTCGPTTGSARTWTLAGWTRNHSSDAAVLGKPLVLEEFGKARGALPAAPCPRPARLTWPCPGMRACQQTGGWHGAGPC
jgi:hypothetical protein